ncbi:MAG TPA: efflux RND transporter periplasmic adaptor subunit [Planctomycetaceae bacterium]|nr:efflux RND transporter periplasmic adaptor subunit [Planctomycetaceae bacterium]
MNDTDRSPRDPEPAPPTSAPTPSPHVGEPASTSPAKPPGGFDLRFFLRIALQVLGVFAAGVALLAVLGLAQRLGWISAGDARPAATAAGADVIYTCAMHPQIRQPTPGRCPICGMLLEPIASISGAARDELAVHIEPAARRLANIQTAPVERRPVVQSIATVGNLAAEESRLATLSAYVAGRVERLFADYTGVEVAKGDHLAVLYSPGLYAAQVEYVESRRSLQEMAPGALAVVARTQERLVENARQRLVELGMTQEQITDLERTRRAESRVTIYAPIGGTVTEKLVVEGQYVEAGEPIYRIADLSAVWLMLQLYPEDAARIRFGQHVEAEVQSLPGEFFSGRVAFVNPTVDDRTRTVAVRVEMPNPHRKLRPGDYARAQIAVPLGAEGRVYDADLAGRWISPMHPQIIRDEPGECPICGMDLVPTSRYGYADEPVPQPAALVIPRSAVLMAGANSVVYVETQPGRFEIRPVTIGSILREHVVIHSGVREGEQVATSGNFLIDSQMQLSGKPSLIDPRRAMPSQAAPGQGPLDLSGPDPEPLAGDAGERLEDFYRAYFAIQTSLADDQIPAEGQVRQFDSAGRALLQTDGLPDGLRPTIEAILETAAHLHHLSLDDAREHFQQISRHALRMAARYRGAQASGSFIHFWCSMVPGGQGDWLQAARPPANPYWGSRMLRCVQHERELPLAAAN